jgi:hypothetical protein
LQENLLKSLQPLITPEKLDDLQAAVDKVKGDLRISLQPNEIEMTAADKVRVESVVEVLEQFFPILKALTMEFETDANDLMETIKKSKTLEKKIIR